MTITFACDQCTQRYAVGEDLAGKRIKCKKCGKVLAIPVPKGVVVAAPAVKAAPIPKPEPDDPFGLADSPDFLPDDVPVAQVIHRRGKSSRSGDRPGFWENPTTRYSLIGGGAVALILVVVLIASLSGRKKAGTPDVVPRGDSPAYLAHKITVDQSVAALKDLNDAVAEITDEATARAAEPKVSAAIDRLQVLADRSTRATKLGPKEKQKLASLTLAETEPAIARWRSEMERLRGVPGAADQLARLAGRVRVPD